MKTLLVLFGLLSLAFCERRHYDGCEVWELQARTTEELHLLHRFHELYDNGERLVTFWEPPRTTGETVEVLLCGEGLTNLRKFIQATGISAKLTDTNIQQELDALYARNDARHEISPFAYEENEYNTYQDIMDQLEVLQANCPHSFECVIEDIGFSYEGRVIRIFRILRSEGNRQAIWLDALTHAREWLAGATLMGILTTLINNYTTNDDAKYLLDTYDWHIVPVVNPDGYVYTWTDDRFWRKNRSPNADSTCIGTDLNRNFDFMWGTQGSSDLQCSETYHGSGAASEPETQVIQNTGLLVSDLVLWVTYHTYDWSYLFPYGSMQDGSCMVSDNYQQLLQVGQAAVDAVQGTYNVHSWRTGGTCEDLYAASGITQDWAHAVAGVSYTYTPELRGPGFNPAPTNIAPSIQENWNGLVAMVNEIGQIGLEK